MHYCLLLLLLAAEVALANTNKELVKAMVEKAKPSWKEMSYAAPPCIPAWCVSKQCTWNLTATQVFSYFQDFAAPYEYSCFLF